MQQILSSEQLDVCIKHAGAELCSVKDRKGTEFMWQASPEVWPRHAPVLFPVVGKLKDNRFDYKAAHYTLGQHGFARDRSFRLVESSAAQCVFELSSDNESRNIYPFDFTLQIGYALKQNVLTTTYKIINPSQEPLLFSIGAHPGFLCPLGKNGRWEDHYLEFEHTELWVTELQDGLRKADKRLLRLPDKKLHLSADLFDKDALVFEKGQVQRIQLCSGTSAHKISMECEGWPYFGIWSKRGCGEFVCLEPWYGIADRTNASGLLTEKEGILELKAGQEFSCSFSVTFI